MKTKTLEFLRKFKYRLNRSRRWLLVAVITLCLIPRTRSSGNRRPSVAASYHHEHSPRPDWRRIDGNAEGECRSEQFRQEIIWPLALINQARSFVSATRARYTGLMSQIEGIKNNSATLALPMQLESMSEAPSRGPSADSLAIHAGLPAGRVGWNCPAGAAQPHGH